VLHFAHFRCVVYWAASQEADEENASFENFHGLAGMSACGQF
jgi:hypothetical protein